MAADQGLNRHGVDLINDALPFGCLWYGEPDAIPNTVGYAKFYSRSQCPKSRSARAMQDCVRLALLHFLEQLTGFQCRRCKDLDTAPFRLC